MGRDPDNIRTQRMMLCEEILVVIIFQVDVDRVGNCNPSQADEVSLSIQDSTAIHMQAGWILIQLFGLMRLLSKESKNFGFISYL